MATLIFPFVDGSATCSPCKNYRNRDRSNGWQCGWNQWQLISRDWCWLRLNSTKRRLFYQQVGLSQVSTKGTHMRSSVFAIVASTILYLSPAHAGEQKTEVLKAGGAVAAGAVVGGGAFAVVGSGGLVIAGTAVAIGAAPFVAGGAIVGLAGYGIYRVATDLSTPSANSVASTKPAQPTAAPKR